MALECPNCGSRFLRESRPRDASERGRRWRFVSPLRCMDCKTRFAASTLNIPDMRFAHCPQCDRMDLNHWTGKNFEPPFLVGLWARLGANRWRCEYCRLNFCSFRPRKEVFTFGRWKNLNSGDAVALGRARVAEMEARVEDALEQAEAEARVAANAAWEAELQELRNAARDARDLLRSE